ncbi:unnamed protein product [Mytilus edulis]|uniref:B box-type domain-containing protein n=1 Tax=Mytilus edulis TaxID=6550 RepID=A0A8S3U660_MYTED|nr:unnamed protein product [Mytilus edulis]
MATNTSKCVMCDQQHKTPSSEYWCMECKESLCSSCKERHSLSKERGVHTIAPLSQFVPTIVSDLQPFCIDHNENYQHYCIKHECLICYKCITKHGKCDQVIPLEEVVSNVKTSELFRDLEQSLKDALENIKRIHEDRENNFKSFQTQKRKISMEIEKIKAQINQHLDELKEDFIKELKKVHHNINDEIQLIIASLKDQEKEMEHCDRTLQYMKRFASDLQTFLGMREVQSKVTDTETRLRSMIANESLDNVGMKFELDDKMQDILSSVKTFGSISVTKSPSAETNMFNKKTRQAQISVPYRMQSIKNLSVDFKQTLDTSCEWLRGCSITRKGVFLFTNYFNSYKKLIAVNTQGKTEYTIQLSDPYNAFDVECMDENTVAVTTGKSYKLTQLTGISIVDLTKRKVTKFINLPGFPYGITYDGKSFICCVEDKDLHVVSCSDYSITTIPNTTLPRNSYVSSRAGMIFFTNPDSNKISCCLYDGTAVWEFNRGNLLHTPRGITVDDKGNVFVVGQDSCNCIVISPDRKQYKEILTRKSGLSSPSSIFFNRIKKQLLVTNNSSIANVYNISYF